MNNKTYNVGDNVKIVNDMVFEGLNGKIVDILTKNDDTFYYVIITDECELQGMIIKFSDNELN